MLKRGSHMQYRINRRTGDKISEIGMGSAYLYEADRNEAIQALQTAYEGGINYYDLAAGHGKAFPLWGEALASVRKNVFYQIHFGADYSKGEYGWSLDLETVKRSVAWMHMIGATVSMPTAAWMSEWRSIAGARRTASAFPS